MGPFGAIQLTLALLDEYRIVGIAPEVRVILKEVELWEAVGDGITT